MASKNDEWRQLAMCDPRRRKMTFCPIALAAGCKKCPAFSFCPLKTVIGDYVKEEESPSEELQEKKE